jgi:hypothetical protein
VEISKCSGYGNFCRRIITTDVRSERITILECSMLQHTIESRKRRTEDYACDSARKVQSTRKKCAGRYWNRYITRNMRGTFKTDEFMSKIPAEVVREFIGQSYRGFEHFIFSRNSPDHIPDLEWISKTETYQKASAQWVEYQVRDTICRQRPLEILREYRHRHIPLQITVVPSYSPYKHISLPHGSNVFVNQVLSNSVKVDLSISDTETNKDPFTLSLSDAWDLVAGPADAWDLVCHWQNLVPRPHAFQHALSRILQDERTESTMHIRDRGCLPYLRLDCVIDRDRKRESPHNRAIEFHFASSETFTKYMHVYDSIDVPVEVLTCIAGSLNSVLHFVHCFTATRRGPRFVGKTGRLRGRALSIVFSMSKPGG